jgi:hypothetical protein
MKVVFSASNQNAWISCTEMKVQNMLHSFAYKDTLMGILKQPQRFNIDGMFFLIDSGAFSAWTKQKAINIDEYIEFCHFLINKYPTTKFRPVNLDCIPGGVGRVPSHQEREISAEKGWKNYEYMRSKGLNPIHVFHQFEDFKWLHKLADSSDYIGISPDNSQSVQSRVSWLKKVYSIIRDTVKTHGFACTGSSFMKVAPFYSVDSASWTIGPRFGTLMYFDELDGNIKALRLQSLRTDPELYDKFVKSIFPKIREFLDIPLSDIMTNKPNQRFCNNINIAAYLQAEKFYTKMWDARGIKFTD